MKGKEIMIGPFNKAGVFMLESVGYEVKCCYSECHQDKKCPYECEKVCPYYEKQKTKKQKR